MSLLGLAIPPWAYAAAAALVVGGAAYGGWTVRGWKADSDQLAAVAKAEQVARKQQQDADAKATAYEEQRSAAAAATQGRDTEIRTYYRDHNIAVPVDCAPPPAAVRVLDDAIAAANAHAAGKPEPSMSPDPKASGAVHGP